MLLSKLLGRRGGKGRSILPVSMISCAAFIALAVWGWGLSTEAVLQFLLISVVCLVAIILAALLGTACIVLIKKLFQ